MTAATHGPEPRDELLGVTRALYSAAIAARPIVEAARHSTHELGPSSTELRASSVLDELDGALADAGDYVGGGAE